MNIILIGYRCSGKTEIGKRVARELGRDFVDTDALIEEDAGVGIETFVHEYGWDHFRKVEKRVIDGTSRKDGLVVATGGGVVLDETNMKNLKSNGWIVWLSGSAEVLQRRMALHQQSGKTRPSLTGADPVTEIEEVLRVRTPLYKKSCDWEVDTDNLTILEVTKKVLEAFGNTLKT